MTAILIGMILGIVVCLFIPPEELKVKLLNGIIKFCEWTVTKGREQLERIEKENEENRDKQQD